MRATRLALVLLPLSLSLLTFTCARDEPPAGGEGAPPGPWDFPGEAPATPSPTPPAIGNPILAENALPGSSEWEIRRHAGSSLAAWADEVSIARGGSVGIRVSSDSPDAIGWEVFRMGWYGGAGARLVARSTASIPVGPREVPAPDPVTGLVECSWPVTFTLTAGDGWVTGMYLVKIRRGDGRETYAWFVLRDDERRGAAVLQIPATTYVAYNEFGGESLYRSSIGLPGGKAKEVSFDRPYHEGAGAGQYLKYDQYFVRWAEAQGYDLIYVTNVDFERDPGLLEGQRLFLSIGHDEYWSRTQREAVESALARGTSLAFFSANDAYWQIRVESARRDGREARTVVCWKNLAKDADPLRGTNLVTTLWRSPEVDEPENELLGVMYTDYQYVDVPWIVTSSGAWPYEGTGLSDGDALPLVVGYEADRAFDNGRAPTGLTLLSRSPILTYRHTPDWHNAATYDAPSGAFVFAAATIQWSWGLSGEGMADARVQRITKNVFTRAGLAVEGPGADFLEIGAFEPAMSGASWAVSVFAGKPWVEGFTDGPANVARFRRPLGAAVDAAGNIYVADAGNHAIRRIANDPEHTVTTIAGTGHAGRALGGSARFDTPSSIAIAADGSLAVVDTGNQRVVRVVRDGGGWTAELLAGSSSGSAGAVDGTAGEARFNDPAGIASDGEYLYVADTKNSLLRKVTLDGVVTAIVGTNGMGSVDGPGSVARLRFPTGVTFGNGALWVVDSGNRQIRKVALDGAYTTSTVAGSSLLGGFRDGDPARARFMPHGSPAWLDGALFVPDTGNNRVRRVASGTVTTFVGSGGAVGSGTRGADASIPLPTSVVALPDGRLLVVSQGDSTLRVIGP